jgi:hypothetical protein
MLASITPLGERGRGSTWGVTVVAFALGATAAGALAGAVSAALGAVLLPAHSASGPRLLAAAVACALAGGVDAARASAPGPRRQVDERWLDTVRGWVYGLGFGAQLGLGVVTRVTSAALYAAIVIALLTASPSRGALVLGSYGLIRGLTPLLAAGVRTPGQLVRLHARLIAWRRLSRAGAVAALAGATLAAILGALL